MVDPNPYQRPLTSRAAAGASRFRFVVFGLCCGTSWTLYLHRYAFGLIKPMLAKEWHVPLVELGAMDTAFSLGYNLLQVPSGLLADLLGTHVFLTAIILIWSLSLGLHAWVKNPGQMYPVRFLFGAAQAGAYPALSKVTRQWFPLAARTTVQGLVASFFGRLGAVGSNLIVASLLIGTLALGWHDSFLILATAGVVLSVCFGALFRSTPARHPWVNSAECAVIMGGAEETNRSDAETSLGQVQPAWYTRWREVRARSFVNFACLLLAHFGATFADAIYMSWVPYFLKTEHGLDIKQMGIYSMLPLLGGALGGLTAGVMNDRLIRMLGSRRWGRSLVAVLGNLAACALVLGALAVYDQPYIFCWILFAAKFFADWTQPSTWGTITDISGGATASVFGTVNSLGGSGGLFSPIAFAAIAEHFGWHTVFIVVAGAYVVTAVAWCCTDATIPLFAKSTAESGRT